ncbi:DUF1254 domain-containing protein [Novosphingobium cyanobacteriorum]|uniref:DUF1254 domain-containing protein n=1 Tax=Novosphingobium cyanobacteriorum TaxID=3024215 RepID=A0ABT6CDI0_9SPHN|nr:DUF1254 domain-containing protein [Novosphingobium cyanobacteriorum]MDF8331989.1 DUF1254 domain-containing protein [Novosphingobium cyanobacteriorum]
MTETLTPEAARAIAEEAFVYAYPIVHGYRAIHWLGVRKGGFNRLDHYRHIIDPADDLNKEVQINLDTLYTLVPFDMRREPLVLTVPAFPDRYFSVQFSDFYMHNYAWLGTRTTGQGGGRYLLAGPGWNGEKPEGIDAMIPCDTEISYFIIRILCRGKADEPAVNAIQDGFRLEPLSTFLGTTPPAEAPDPEWMWPSKTMFNSTDIYSYFNYLLRFLEPREDERELFAEFARINLGWGKHFALEDFAPDIQQAIREGATAAFERICAAAASPGKMVDGWYLVPRIRGNRELLSGTAEKRFTRAVQARVGIYGTDLEECVYIPSEHEADGSRVDPSTGDYILTLKPPVPATGFWSITAYAADTQFLVPNELGRYALGDRDPLIIDPDGLIRIHLQQTAPKAERMANWLPVPGCPLLIVLRLYIPSAEVVAGNYVPPPIVKAAA